MSEARERVLDAAEKLFMDQGYAAISMRDIAGVLGLQQAALYYHVKGKEELFMAVVERNMQRQRTGLEQAIASAPDDLEAQLKAIAHWLVEHMPVDMIRMLRSDAAHISPTYASQLLRHVAESMMEPILSVIQPAQRRGEVQPMDPNLLAGMLIGVMNWVAYFDQEALLEMPTEAVIEQVIAVLLHGMIVR